MRYFFSFCFIIALNFSGSAEAEPYYHRVTVKSGDGVLSLLRRYKLANHQCNVDQFYTLNSMKKNAQLIKGKKYKIPVLIYKYNGKSIRSTVGIDNWDMAVRIKRFNEYLVKNRLRRSHYANSKILWVPYHEIHCMAHVEKSAPLATAPEKISTPIKEEIVTPKNVQASEKPSSSSKYRVEPLFGKTYSNVEIKSKDLSDKVFFIVAGHGGPDPGAMCTDCPNTMCEDEYAYDVCLRLARNLMSKGAHVEIIIQDKNDGIRDHAALKCDKDEKCYQNRKIPLNQKKRLQQRCDAINTLAKQYKAKGIYDQRVVSIHIDSRDAAKRQDVFFYYFKGSAKSKRMAFNIHETFKNKYKSLRKGRGYKGYVDHRNLYLLRSTNPPAVFIELGNIKNSQDRQRFLLKSNRELLASWIAEGIVK